MCDGLKGQIMWLGLFLLCALSEVAWCDYKCVCNYIVERQVLSMPSNDSDVMGYMYEFDCKPIVVQNGSWFTVAFEHKLGYVEAGERLEIQTCPGNYPDADKVTSSNTTTTVPLDAKTTITQPYTTNATVPLGIKSTITISQTTSTIAPSTSPAMQTTSPQSTSAPRVRAETMTLTTPTPSTTTRTTEQVTESAFHACEVLTHQSNTAFAYNNYCYELVTQHSTFQVAEANCMTKGGHLAHIKNDQEQQILTSNAKHYQGDDYIWIGLHDTAHEEQFEWTSGESVTYTHWKPGRKDFLLHFIEDCVALKVESFVNDAAWEDLPCSRAHPYICQFGVPSTINLVEPYCLLINQTNCSAQRSAMTVHYTSIARILLAFRILLLP